VTTTVVLFAILGSVVACAAIGVAVSQSVVRSAVWLLMALAGVAGLYFLLGADVLGATQLIVYVGGTLVLIVFGVMITNEGAFAVLPVKRIEWVLGGVLSFGLFGLLAKASIELGEPVPMGQEEQLPSASELGLSFLGYRTTSTAYLLPFELVSVHLLVALVAAAYLARAKKQAPPAG